MTRGGVSVLPQGRAPTQKPSFTVGELRKAIPKHCWQRSALHSFAYVVADLVMAAGLFAFSQAIDRNAPTWLACLAWPLYWFFQVQYATANVVLYPYLVKMMHNWGPSFCRFVPILLASRPCMHAVMHGVMMMHLPLWASLIVSRFTYLLYWFFLVRHGACTYLPMQKD